MKFDPQIDELLNGYIDGELNQRQQTEVRRLLANDANLMRRLRELQKCKELVRLLPAADAPYGLGEDIRTSLERRSLLREPSGAFEQRKGARHLLGRRILAAAAMIGLAGLLVAVVYTVLVPAEPGGRTVAVEPRGSVEDSGAARREAMAGSWPFRGTVELRAAAFMEGDASINRMIENSGLSDCTVIERQPGRSRYGIACTRADLALLLANLGYIWGRFDSTRLSVETGEFSERVVVDGVTIEQIGEIVGRGKFEEGLGLARNFAVLNDVTERMPGKEITVAVEESGAESIALIPMPRLTKDERLVKRQVDRGAADVHLAIVVAGVN
ncbi:MAG: hypothetical protein JSU94_17170 [Phycisphaerales bacterium]|nr:MAG: hypothetical protein JSU94_17170 [Phycisphaerales bacterium]